MIKAGLIGGKLSHSLSPQVHQKYWHLIGKQGQYALLETPADKLSELLDALTEKGYIGANVTIPHKKAVMRHLDVLSPEADAIGAVNTIHFSDGRRIGYNTDYFGLLSTLLRFGMPLCNKRVVILGTGGAAVCAFCLSKDQGASEVLVISRQPQKADKRLGALGYDALEALDSIDVLINTTPSGMFPDIKSCPVSVAVIQKCKAVADVIYNPEQTQLLKKAAEMGKPCAGGLWMLCAQALKAQEIWLGRAYDASLCASIFNALRTKPDRTNIVLIGMPGSGKTTVGHILSKRLGREYADTDMLVEASHGRIQDIFAKSGEAAFRALELTAARGAAAKTRAVISTGGGIVLTQASMEALRETGIIVYIDRPMELLLCEVDTADRPLLAGGRQRLISLFSQRRMLYQKYADITVQNAADAAQCVDDIVKKLKEYKS